VPDGRPSGRKAVPESRLTAGMTLTREDSMQLTERHHEYWRKNLRITSVLLAIWFVVTFVVAFFARDLNFSFFGWPFSFWVASQGADRLHAHHLVLRPEDEQPDQEHGVAEEEA
jgi:putative solute:sodium symporter small subunit